MESFDFASLIVAFPAAVVLLAWIQDLRGQVKETREDLERLHNDYIQHLKNGYNTSIELAPEMKPKP